MIPIVILNQNRMHIAKLVMKQEVNAIINDRTIPTSELGKPEINPVFFEKRVYQGSNGKVYCSFE